jgi:NAD(P)-dependent dehydrogenase (short-subunit alcohol dehydrogenase family)
MKDPAAPLTALITGATSGIGRALTLTLTASGVQVFAAGRNEAALAELQEATGCRGAVADFRDRDAPMAIYEAATKALAGAPHFLINNAGYNSRKAALVEVTDQELEQQWLVNLRAPSILCRQALCDMGSRRSGHIVNIISTVVHMGIPTMSVYSMMKQGLYGLTKVLIKEGQEVGVKVTAVHPGGTDTNFREKQRPDYMRPESAAEMIRGVLFAPADVVVHDLTFRPPVEANF